jgi:FMN phosphatase YigB (HAD superfamily)/DNA-binding XRE family transcriptional regulator
MAMDEKGLGKQLQRARQAAGLTQQQLCQKANLSFSTLTKIERGAIKSPSIFTVQAIAQALGTSLDVLIGAATPATPGRHLLQTKSGVRFVYFDVNGCLVRFYQRAFAQIAEETGNTADTVETAHWHYTDDACRGVMTMDDFNQAMAKRLGVESIDWSKFYLETAEAVPGMPELLSWAIERYKIGLLTNIMPGLLKGLQQHGKVPNLPYDAVINSSEVGTIKPEEKIFEIAGEHAGVAPSEILLVDDTQANLKVAESLGWHVLWFDYARPEESVENIRAALEPAT